MRVPHKRSSRHRRVLGMVMSCKPSPSASKDKFIAIARSGDSPTSHGHVEMGDLWLSQGVDPTCYPPPFDSFVLGMIPRQPVYSSLNNLSPTQVGDIGPPSFPRTYPHDAAYSALPFKPDEIPRADFAVQIHVIALLTTYFSHVGICHDSCPTAMAPFHPDTWLQGVIELSSLSQDHRKVSIPPQAEPSSALESGERVPMVTMAYPDGESSYLCGPKSAHPGHQSDAVAGPPLPSSGAGMRDGPSCFLSEANNPDTIIDNTCSLPPSPQRLVQPRVQSGDQCSFLLYHSSPHASQNAVDEPCVGISSLTSADKRNKEASLSDLSPPVLNPRRSFLKPFGPSSPFPNKALGALYDLIKESKFFRMHLPEPAIDSSEGQALLRKIQSCPDCPHAAFQLSSASIFTLFISDPLHRCQICGESKNMPTVEKLLGCVRSHLGYRPFRCAGCVSFPRHRGSRMKGCRTPYARRKRIRGQMSLFECIKCDAYFRPGI